MNERPLRALLAIAIVLIAVPWAFKLASQERLGESCEGGFDCAVISGRCVMGEQGRFCTQVCTLDDECPSKSHCGVPPHDFFQVWFSTSPISERVCVPGPRPEQPPSLADFEAPVAPAGEAGHVGAQPPPVRKASAKSR
ncbi:hypothetical protein ACNOYE_02805 [Nannocystaceae bacterium ST9]